MLNFSSTKKSNAVALNQHLKLDVEMPKKNSGDSATLGESASEKKYYLHAMST